MLWPRRTSASRVLATTGRSLMHFPPVVSLYHAMPISCGCTDGGVSHIGIVFVVGNKSLGEIIRWLVLLHQVVPDDEMPGRVEYL